jgi:hypothetical protein
MTWTMMNTGEQLATAMWALTGFSLALVVLRLYTRIMIVKFVGAEDHMYAWTGVSPQSPDQLQWTPLINPEK